MTGVTQKVLVFCGGEAHSGDMSNQPVKTVSVVCACGVSFERPIQRGRPQKWCPTCREVSFYDRTSVSAAVQAIVTATASVEPSVAPVAAVPANQWDDQGDHRPAVEAAVKDVYAAHHAEIAERTGNGESLASFVADLQDRTGKALVAAYKAHGK